MTFYFFDDEVAGVGGADAVNEGVADGGVGGHDDAGVGLGWFGGWLGGGARGGCGGRRRRGVVAVGGDFVKEAVEIVFGFAAEDNQKALDAGVVVKGKGVAGGNHVGLVGADAVVAAGDLRGRKEGLPGAGGAAGEDVEVSEIIDFDADVDFVALFEGRGGGDFPGVAIWVALHDGPAHGQGGGAAGGFRGQADRGDGGVAGLGWIGFRQDRR